MQHTLHWLTAVGQYMNCLWVIKYCIIIVEAFSVRIIRSTPLLRKVYSVVVLFYTYRFFMKKTAPNAPEKLQTSININKHASKVRFISKAIEPVTGSKRFQCALKCNRLQPRYNPLSRNH